jgi:hypothetical protein
MNERTNERTNRSINQSIKSAVRDVLATIVAFLGVETGRRLRNAREAGLVASCYERMVAGRLQEVDDREDKRRRLAAKFFGRIPLPFTPGGVNAAVREIQEEDGNSDGLRAVEDVGDVAFGGGGGGGGGGEGEGGGGDDSDDSDDSALDSESESDEDNDDDHPGLFLPAPRRGATNAQFHLASPGEGQLRRTTDAMRQLALTLRPSTA